MANKARTTVFAIVLLGILAVFAKTVAELTQDRVRQFSFPTLLALDKAQQIDSQPLPVKTANAYSRSIAAQRYQYNYQGYPLTIEVSYVVGTLGDLEEFSQHYKAFELPTGSFTQGEMRQQGNGGFYQVYVHQDQAYLSACLGPRGNSSVTGDQFINHWNSHWYVLGSDVLDNRCLWTHLQVPLQGRSTSQAYTVLESAWLSWSQRWRSRFPKVDV